MASISVSSHIKQTAESLSLNTCSASVTVSEQSYDIAGNYSIVKVSYSASITSNRTFTGTSRPNAGVLRIIVNGVTTDITMPFNSGMRLGSSICSGSYTQQVGHNADGSKSVGFSAQIVEGSDQRNYNVVWVNSAQATGSQTLTTIPRASKPTYSTNPLTIGRTQTITTNRAASGFTHTLVLSFGDYSETLTGVGASTTWTPPASLMQYMDHWQMTVTVTCTTYNGSTQIGSSTSSFTLQVDTSIYKPVITWGTAADTNASTSALETAGSFIKHYSNLQIPVTAAPNDTTYGDTVDSLTVSLGDVTQQSAVGGLSVMVNFMANGITTATLTATATDSRGYSVTATKTLTLIDYSPIVIESINTVRVNQNGEPTETGEYIKYTIKGSAFLGSFGQVTNSIRVRTKSKLVSDADYGAWVNEQTVTTSGSGFAQFTINGITVGTYLSSTQYDVVFRLEDALTARQSGTIRIHEGIPVYAWGKDHFDVYGELHVHNRNNVRQYKVYTYYGDNWKLIGETTGSGTVAFGDAFYYANEIMFEVEYEENSTYTWTTHSILPRAVFTKNKYEWMGARIAPTASSDFGCVVHYNTTEANIFEIHSNRVSVINDATLRVYYR